MLLKLWASLVMAGSALGPQPPAAPVAPLPSVTVLPSAPAAPDGVLRVNLVQALRLGLAHDRDLRMRGYDTASAKQAVTRAWSVYHPQISLDSSASVFDSARTGITSGAGATATQRYDVSLRVEQLLFDLGTGLFEIYRTRQAAKAAGFNELAAELTAAQTVVADFYDVLRQDALEKLQTEILSQATRQREQATALFEAGKGARLDVTRATVTEQNAKVDLEVAANRTRDALARLRRDLGLAPGTPLVATEETPVPPVDIALTEALGLGEKTPSVLSLEAAQRAQKHALDSSRVQRWASLRVTGSFDYYLANSRDTNSEYVLGATLSLPLWDGRAKSASAEQARLSWLRAGEQLAKEREQVRLDIEQAHLANRDAVSRLTAAEQAGALAAESLLQTQESYRLGAASLLDVGDARTEYQRAESNRITARLDRDLAAMALRIAVGRLPLTDEALAATTEPVKPAGLPGAIESKESGR